jgi:hypothetical protein
VKKTALALVALAALGLTAACAAPDTPAASPPSPAMDHHESASATAFTATPELAGKFADARAATAKYVDDLDAAKADGYMIITQMMPGMGYHYLNPKVQGFDITKPAILVYEKTGSAFQLAALEWVWPEHPATAPIEGATYGTFPAACHYKDGTFKAAQEAQCADVSPETGSPFTFWHPELTTLHVWLWYQNPDGVYHGTNPLVPQK